MALTFQNLHVLVAEDLQPMQALMSEILYALGVGKVTTVKDGSDAWHSYCSSDPDIIITDWQMPVMDGLELIKKVRQDKLSPNRTIPLIMMTGFCAAERISLSRDAGVTEFLVKPFSADDITKRLTYIIHKPRDFIVTPTFAGPDRRRKEQDGFEVDVRKNDTDKKIKASDILVQKAGTGLLDKALVEKSQNIIEKNRVDFIPIARQFLGQLQDAITACKAEDNQGRRAIEDLIDPIMQIKANACIFKYDLVGNLANVTLSFLENLNEVDEYIIELMEAHQKTLAHILDNEMEGTGGDSGQSLETELQSAFSRYMRAKSQISKGKLKKVKD